MGGGGHQMVILKLRAATCTKIAVIPTDNANFGKYLNSIITTYFPAGTEEEQLMSTSMPFWNEYPTRQITLSVFTGLLQSHRNHNQSCYLLKKDHVRVALSQVCRYLDPTFQFNYPSGLYQLVVFDDRHPNRPTIKNLVTYICKYIQPATTTLLPSFLQQREDSRIIVAIQVNPITNINLPTDPLPSLLPPNTPITKDMCFDPTKLNIKDGQSVYAVPHVPSLTRFAIHNCFSFVQAMGMAVTAYVASLQSYFVKGQGRSDLNATVPPLFNIKKRKLC